jgi:heptosyltransferase-3
MPDTTVRRVLIYRLGSLGDTIVALPCLHLIARAYPHAERRLLTNFPVNAKAPAAQAVLGDSGLIHGYMSYTLRTRRPVELIQLAAKIRSYKPDVLVYLMHIRPWKAVVRDRLFFRLAGVRHIVGISTEAEMKFRFDAASGLFERESARLARLISGLGNADPADLSNWDLRFTAAERERAREVLDPLAGHPLLVCGPGTKMQSKDWGADNWRTLLALFDKKYPGHGLALVGAREEHALAEHVARAWSGPKVNLCGQLAPRETAAVMEHAQLFLGPDSGSMHLAARAGVPCVIAFSAAAPAGIWFPPGNENQIAYHRTPCAGCYNEACAVHGHPCLKSISVDEMESAVDRAMRGEDGNSDLIVIS